MPKKPKRKKMGYEDAMDLSKCLRGSLKIQNSIEFSDMKIKPPGIDFYPDGEQFFDPAQRQIHIGVYGIVDTFDVEDDTDFANALNYVRGHESQHCRCTAARPYAVGIQKGCEAVLEYISAQVEPTRRRFKKPSDYEEFADKILPGMGIYISWETVQRIIAGIANSVEDGRIERIRSFRFPGFEKLRIIYRGRFWESSEGIYPPYTEIQNDAAQKLRIIVNQILSLATCQLYTKGFIMAYGGTPIVQEVRDLMPYIGRGVLASRTRDMADQVIEISRRLAPYIYETCKMSQSDMDARKILEELLKNLIAAMLDKEPASDLSEGNEDQESGCSGSTFPMSDLEITLPDEEFDKLMEKNKGRGGSDGGGGGIMVKREHPKEDDDNGSEGNNSNSGNKPEGQGGGDGKGKGNSSTSGGKNSSGAGASAHKNMDVEAVKRAMEEAATEMNEVAAQQIETVDRSSRAADKMVSRIIPDTDPIVTAAEVKTLIGNGGFTEMKRAYKLTEKLPPEVASRGRVLYRKNEQYFRSLSTPNITYLDSGSVDPSRIYGLSFGDTEIFRKKGIDKKFDGCCYILIDNSGSMGGDKRIEACKAAAVIEEGFRGLIPIKIVAFDDAYNGVVHEVIKGWEEQQRYNCCWNFCKQGRSGGGTPTRESVLVATKEILARPEQKKLIVVLTDGEPADQAGTKKAIQQARRSGITVAGIYFEIGSIDRAAKTFNDLFDNRDIVCTELSNVDAELSALLKKFSRS